MLRTSQAVMQPYTLFSVIHDRAYKILMHHGHIKPQHR